MRKLREETEEMLALPVLVALSRKPMKSPDLARLLLISPATLKKRLTELERLGFIVQRVDKKWVMKVILRAEPLPVASHVPGVDGEGEIVLAPRDDAQEPAGAPRRASPAPVPKPAPSKGSESLVESRVSKQAQTMKIPERIDGLGELSFGAGARCKGCAKPTPVKYGTAAVCPNCARVWEKQDRVGRS